MLREQTLSTKNWSARRRPSMKVNAVDEAKISVLQQQALMIEEERQHKQNLFSLELEHKKAMYRLELEIKRKEYSKL